MSRIGKKPIIIPKGVKIEQNKTAIKVTGPLGSLELDCYPHIKVEVDETNSVMSVKNERPEILQSRQMHGTVRSLLSNMVLGVTKGFEKKLEIYGTGYSVKEQSGKIVLQVGFSNPVQIPVPKGIKVKIEVEATRGDDTPARFILSSVDKHFLGQFAADIRKVRPPEPYKGKGIRYFDEYVKRKVGKAFASGTV